MDEMKKKQIEIYEHYGLGHQLDKLEEECLELALALKRYRTTPKDSRYAGNVVEETADVLNLIEQIIHGNPHLRKEVQELKELKIKRQLGRIASSPR